MSYMSCNEPCANNMCPWNLGNCCLDVQTCSAQEMSETREGERPEWREDAETCRRVN